MCLRLRSLSFVQFIEHTIELPQLARERMDRVITEALFVGRCCLFLDAPTSRKEVGKELFRA